MIQRHCPTLLRNWETAWHLFSTVQIWDLGQGLTQMTQNHSYFTEMIKIKTDVYKLLSTGKPQALKSMFYLKLALSFCQPSPSLPCFTATIPTSLPHLQEEGIYVHTSQLSLTCLPNTWHWVVNYHTVFNRYSNISPEFLKSAGLFAIFISVEISLLNFFNSSSFLGKLT